MFKAKMRGYEEIKSWILSMGAYVEVVEPDRLRNDILLEIEKMKKIYWFFQIIYTWTNILHGLVLIY